MTGFVGRKLGFLVARESFAARGLGSKIGRGVKLVSPHLIDVGAGGGFELCIGGGEEGGYFYWVRCLRGCFLVDKGFGLLINDRALIENTFVWTTLNTCGWPCPLDLANRGGVEK